MNDTEIKTGMESPPVSGFLRASKYMVFEPLGDTGYWSYQWDVTDKTAIDNDKLVVVDLEGPHAGSYGVRFETFLDDDGEAITTISLVEKWGIYEPELATYYGKMTLTVRVCESQLLIYASKGRADVGVIDVPGLVYAFKKWLETGRGY